ncbi:MAG: DUF3784 domain-containing protein [Tannerella sp.]|jgi:hypothetical protein|nr:DUF3784 domain-containing protein [Tannerella sp.]
MNKAVNIIEQVIKSGDVVFVGVGILFILIAIVVGVFKQTWLISGVNTMPKEKLAKMDLEYVAKYFGLFFGIFGGIVTLSPFIFIYLNIMKYFGNFFMISTLGFCAFLILYFNVIKRKRIYNKTNTGQTQPMDVLTKKRRKFILIAIVAPVLLLIYFISYKEPKVEIDTNAFKLKGVYGVNLPFPEIAEADTIVWSKMPAISIRTNGVSLNKVNRGKFKTTDGEKIHLSIYRGVSPVIRIVGQDASVYYINRKNAAETRQIFKKIHKHLTN